jgi:hypothetical protein
MAQPNPTVRLTEVELPDFGVPQVRAELSKAIHTDRFERFVQRLRDAGLTAATVYADREHLANLSYLTGFDPRFEEALMVVVPGRDPVILTGPENQGTARAASINAEVKLFPPFGLLGQDRSRTPPLADLLRDAGIAAGAKVGTVGWKYYGRQETSAPAAWIEVPSFIVDTIRSIVDPSGSVSNATEILMGASGGLRAVNEIDQLAQFEFAASHASESIKRVLFGVRAGLREFEAASLMRPIGLPVCCHPMLSSGPRASLGLPSPSDRVIERGDPFTTAFGLLGSLTARAGFAVADESELPEAIRDYVDRLAAPYFACAAEWYETIGIGVTGGEIDALVKRHLGDPFFNIFLNPGHLIHLDEWMNTPIYPGSTEKLQSGQAIQLDIIPATGSPYFTSNIEDGIALLDASGREEFAERHPGAWSRIESRRHFMASALGIRLKPEVLPFSNLQGYLPPFVLSPRRALVRG